MFDGFQPFTITTQSDPKVDIYGLKSGEPSSQRPALLLVHGFPQTHHIWHRVAPQLTAAYTVVLLDLRGYGNSSKPEDVSQYAKSVMARDCITAMDTLGFKAAFYICAHDRGARVSHKLLVDFPDRVKKAIFLDICPTLAMYTKTNLEFAHAYFHWFFLIQPDPLPETLISASPRKFTELFMGGRQKDGLKFFDKVCFEHYVSILEDPVAVHAMCQDYRASASLDMQEARKDLADGRLIRTPLKVLWGKHGVIEKLFDAVQEWREVTSEEVEVGGYAVESGHYLPEQAPDDVVAAIREFLV
ncbi:Alpha/Beta hydrolase protein [Xylariales sp. AK1849]|nr:Alpha/Beta hydrolase protein [Xylariales sp. AK1849]